MENLFAAGMTDDGHTFTQAEVDAKTTRLADGIGNILHRPDVVVTEEVAALAPLQQVARTLHGYTAYWLASTDARHIAVGLLVKRGVAVSNLHQIGRDATTTESGCADDGVSNKLFERPPLEVDLRKHGLSFTLIGNHLASQSHPEPCRQAQTQFLHDEAATIEAAGGQVMVIGDLNDFEDGAALTQNLVSPGVTLKNLGPRRPPTTATRPVRRPAADPRPHLRDRRPPRRRARRALRPLRQRLLRARRDAPRGGRLRPRSAGGDDRAAAWGARGLMSPSAGV